MKSGGVLVLKRCVLETMVSWCWEGMYDHTPIWLLHHVRVVRVNNR